jgi:hypothetical protein
LVCQHAAILSIVQGTLLIHLAIEWPKFIGHRGSSATEYIESLGASAAVANVPAEDRDLVLRANFREGLRDIARTWLPTEQSEADSASSESIQNAFRARFQESASSALDAVLSEVFEYSRKHEELVSDFLTRGDHLYARLRTREHKYLLAQQLLKRPATSGTDQDRQIHERTEDRLANQNRIQYSDSGMQLLADTYTFRDVFLAIKA